MTFLIRLVWLFLIAQTLIVSAQSASSDEFIKGTWSITYLIRDPQKVLIVPEVASSGFRQTVVPIHRGYQVTVEAMIDPLDAKDSFVFQYSSTQEDPDIIKSLPFSRALGTTRSAFLRSILDFVEFAAPYSNIDQDQSWHEVLIRGNGNCEGRVNLAVELLSRVQITARPVLGCLFEGGKAIFHQWLEVDYPGIGALPCDPGRSQDFVDPMHLVLYPVKSVGIEPRNLMDLGVEIDILSEERFISLFDIKPHDGSSPKGLLRRKMHPIRHAAVIAGSIQADHRNPQSIELSMNGKTIHTESDPFGNFSFTGLTPGEYTIRYYPVGSAPVIRYGTLAEKQLAEIRLTIEKSEIQ